MAVLMNEHPELILFVRHAIWVNRTYEQNISNDDGSGQNKIGKSFTVLNDAVQIHVVETKKLFLK